MKWTTAVADLLSAAGGDFNGRSSLEDPTTIDISDFYELRTNDLFVDKSLFIDYYLRHDVKIACITRPKGWGKSTNLSMLKKFLEIEVDETGEQLSPEKLVNRKLFCGGHVRSDLDGRMKNLKPLKIAHSECSMKHQGRYPIIYADFGSLTGSTADEIVEKLRRLLARLYKQHEYLTNRQNDDRAEKRWFDAYHLNNSKLEEEELKIGLRKLSGLLRDHYQRKAIILIDDYDVPLTSLYGNLVRRFDGGISRNVSSVADIFDRAYRSRDFCRIFNLIWSFLEHAMQNNNASLYRAILTGTFVVRFGNNTFASGGKFDEPVAYGLQDEDFSEHYGFTAIEVDRMLTTNFKTNRDKIRHWYGQKTFNDNVVYYNPLSIRRLLANRGEFRSYWTEQNWSLADYYFRSDDTQQKLHNLVDGKSLSVWISEAIEFDAMIDWSVNYLIFAGYLKPLSYGFGDKSLTVANQELANILKTKIIAWIYRKLNVTDTYFRSIADPLAEFKIAQFQSRLKDILPVVGFTSAVYYKAIVKCLLYVIEDKFVQINLKLDHRRGPNAILISRRRGNADDDDKGSVLLIKYKVIKNPKKLRHEAENELKRIDQSTVAASINLKNYDHVRRILKIGLVFCGNQVEVEHRIDNNTMFEPK